MKIKKANMKRLASLSALGAGAVSANAGAAYASSIVYSGVLNEQLRFDRPFLNSGTFAGPNGPAASLHVRSETSPQHSSLYSVRLNARSGAHGTQFRFLGRSLVGAFPIGRNWSTAATRRNVGAGDQLAFHKYTYGESNTFNSTNFNSKDRYLLFEFTGGKLPETLYGWAYLRVNFPHNGAPETTLVSWAYDSSGATIPAGDRGSKTPEPATFALTGLAALAFGAKGLRAWRAARSLKAGA